MKVYYPLATTAEQGEVAKHLRAWAAYGQQASALVASATAAHANHEPTAAPAAPAEDASFGDE